MVKGNPAKHSGWLCECGEKLKFSKTKTVCKKCGKIYKKEKDKVYQS